MKHSTSAHSSGNRFGRCCVRISRWVVLFLVVAMFPTTLRAATYYVNATGGNDGRTGTAPASAWKTVAKVNNSVFAPGDRILFKRGETWHESLVIPSSGNSALPITFGAYGSGYRPVLDGTYADPIDWQQVQGNIYRTIQPELTSSPGLLLYKGRAKPAITTLRFSAPVPEALKKGAILLQTDGVYTNFWVTSKRDDTVSGITFFTFKTTKNVYVRQLNADGVEEKWPDTLGTPTIISDMDGLTEPGHWYWDEQDQSVYLYSEMDPNTLDVKLARLFTGIHTNGKSFLKIQDIAVNGFKDLGIFIKGTEGSLVENMAVSNIGALIFRTGILVNRSVNNRIKNNTVSSTLRAGIAIYGEPVPPYSLWNSISENTILNPGSSGISLNSDAPSYGYTVENNTISGNTIIGANSLTYDSAGVYSLFVGGGNIIRSNIIKDGGSTELRSSGIMLEGGNDPAVKPVRVEKNIISGNSLAGIAASGRDHGITGNILRNNGVPSWDGAQLLFYSSFGENAANCTVEDNFMEAAANQKLVSVLNGLGTSSQPHLINSNTYFSTNPAPFCWSGWTCDTPLDFVAWQNGTGHDLDSNFTQPLAGTTCPKALCDNTDSGFNTAGSWSVSSAASGFYGNNYLHDQNTNKGGKTASWTYFIDADGNYAIAARWAPHANRNPGVRYSYSVDGDVPVDCGLPADQRFNGGVFNPLCTAQGLTAGSTLTVSAHNDGDGYVIADAVRIGSVGSGLPPTAAFSFSQIPDTLDVDLDATLSTDPDGTVIGYDWDFGDGHWGSGQSVTHSYVAGGTYPVTLKVTDDQNTTGQVTRLVTVQPVGESVCPGPVCDNSDSGFDTAGSWSASSTTPGFYGSNYLHDQNRDKGAKTASWTYLIGADGSYEIAAQWPAYVNRSASVQYSYSVNGTTPVDCGPPVDQRTNGGKFNVLCTVPSLIAGSTLTVRAGNTADGYVIADAVRLVQQ